MSNETDVENRRILVAGATGYVGGRLVRELERRGERVRCLARRPEVLKGRVAPETEVVYADLTAPETLPDAMAEVDTAYYLVHALGNKGDFEAVETQCARHFAEAACAAGVQRIIYLGGLCDEKDAALSPHMRSRQQVGGILRTSGVPAIEFRASIIIGSGSLSFELIRALVRKLPVMVTPRWVSVMAQPIAIGDVLAYLVAALDMPHSESAVYEIGGGERMSYGDLMRVYAEMRGTKRYLIKVPVLTPWLSSLWLSFVTPLYARVGRKLIDSMTTPSVVRDPRAAEVFAIPPVGVRQAIEQALRNEDEAFTATHWADAQSSAGEPRAWGGVKFGSRIVDSRSTLVEVPPEQAFLPIQRIGGATGWYYGNWLWTLRGLLDRCVGGVGMRRGRRDPEALRPGDVVDCWRVERFEPPHRLVLAAEMKLPGRAWLQFDVAGERGGARITQTALFDPVGPLGLVYWYGLYAAHQFVFAGMLRNIAMVATDSTGEERV